MSWTADGFNWIQYTYKVLKETLAIAFVSNDLNALKSAQHLPSMLPHFENSNIYETFSNCVNLQFKVFHHDLHLEILST